MKQPKIQSLSADENWHDLPCYHFDPDENGLYRQKTGEDFSVWRGVRTAETYCELEDELEMPIEDCRCYMYLTDWWESVANVENNRDLVEA